MSLIAELREGLQIIEKYQPEAGVRETCHNAIYVGTAGEDDPPMSAEDMARLEELGWTVELKSWCHEV